MLLKKSNYWWCTFVLVVAGLVVPAAGETFQSIQLRRPDLFHPNTGLRIDRQRSPVPDNIPAPAKRIDVHDVVEMMSRGAVLLDVFGALQSRFDELDGTWLVGKQRLSIPGATWLPETGRGVLRPEIEIYLKKNLERLTDGNPDKPIITFCVSDCWMSWNASQHIIRLGYTDVNWFHLGTDGWLESGRKLVQLDPVPVEVD